MRGMGISSPMYFVGVVENNVDPTSQGRIQVRAFGVHGTNEEIATPDLPWAVCVSGHYDPNSPLPPMNSFVFGMFIDGQEAQNPLILGMIPTQYAEEHIPARDGWGVTPETDGEILSKGFDPRSFGQHQRSKLGRAENLDETYIAPQYTNSKLDQKIADSDKTWDEPPPAYGARYPYNRVIETARHSIEIDDTPGAERIQITHGSGAYIQIDAIGTVTERAESDRYEINIGTKHESSGHSVVTINGNSHVYVKGNKTEEIMGDYKQIVHGEHEISVGGNSFYNVGLNANIRGANLKLEGMGDRVTIFGRNELQMEAEKQINAVSGNINQTALLSFQAYGNKSVKLTSPQDIHIYAVGSIINTATGLAPTSLTPLAGSTGSQTSRGFSVTSPTFNVASATGSFTGVFNASALNTAALLATTLSATTGNFGTLNTAILAAPLPIAPSGGGTCLPNPPGRLVAITAPTVTIPVLNPPGITSIVPTLGTPGAISGIAFPRGNGDGVAFAKSVLASPLAALGFDIPVLDVGGLGIQRIQMPEPASYGKTIVPKGYYALGHAMGYVSDQDESPNQFTEDLLDG